MSSHSDAEDVPRGALGCTCGTPPFAPPEPSADCPFHGASPLGSLHSDRMEIRRLRTERAELMEECELAAEQGRMVGLEADRYRQALETLMEFGKRLMGAETMEERGIGACICESARVIESA